jgi:type I restriction enzyme S subunit
MNKWNRLSTFVKYSTKGITPTYVENSTVLVLNQKCIRDNKIDYSFAQFTDDSRVISESKFVKKGDILINSTGAGTAGRSAFVSELPKGVRVIVDSHILILRCNTYTEAQCLSYVLYSFEETLMSFMTGSSGQSELDKVVLLNLKTNMPTDPGTQKGIGLLLSTLDKKLEVNNRINEVLDKMAATLFNYWFVQFDFPDDKGKPYKSSGGKMLWNEELKRHIPDGWDVKDLSKITSVSNESINPLDFPEKDFKHYSIPAFDKSGTYTLEKGGEIKSSKFVIRENDILVSKLNPRFNRVIYSTDENDLISSTEFVVWRTGSTAFKNYLYMIARDPSCRFWTMLTPCSDLC